MPVHKVGGGYQWGSRGKVYRGSGARGKAILQGRAARAAGYGGGKRERVMGRIVVRRRRQLAR